MARRRDYHAEYQRRQDRAKSEGWKGYSQKRVAKRRWETDPDLRLSWQKQLPDDAPFAQVVNPEYDQRAFSSFYRGLWDRKDRQDTSVDSPKAWWYVVVTGKVATFSDWEERYARG